MGLVPIVGGEGRVALSNWYLVCRVNSEEN